MLINKFKQAVTHLDSLLSLPLEEEQIRFINTPADFKQTLIRLIRNAKSRIYMTALYWQNDEAGEDILREIYLAKQRNPDLDVKLFVDFHRANRNLIGEEKSSTNRDWYRNQWEKHALTKTDNLFFGVPINTREVFGVLHLKGFIFDNTVLYSGASINNVYLHQREKYRYDRYHEITHPTLADVMVAFIHKHLLNTDAVLPLDDENVPNMKSLRQTVRAFRKNLALNGKYAIPSAQSQGDLTITPLFGLGIHNNLLNRTIEDLFNSVNENLIICTPYFNLPRSLKNTLARLLAKGKRVEIIVGDKTANDFYIPPTQPFKLIGALPYLYESHLRSFSQKFERYLLNHQLTIRTWKDDENTYHLKGIWVDGRDILLTGNNLNPRAWRLDAENGLLIRDPQGKLKAQVQHELETIRQHTRILRHHSELDKLSNYPPEIQKLLKKFARLKADKLVKMIL